MTREPYRGDGPPATEPPETATYLSGSSASGDAGGAEASGRSVFLPSEILADRFRVVRLLGRGGMGEVYEVEDLELGERVAVKTLRSRLTGSDRALALFRSEVQLARRVTHPNACRIFDVFRHQRRVDGREESVVFLTMELLSGPTLSSHLRDGGPLSLAAALPLLRQVADALDAAHQAGVVHRDLKSGNVMLVESAKGPRAVVTDFGLAALARDVGGSESSPYGTVPYRAPEVEAGEPAAPAVDLYAFGVLLYEMLNGRPAVPGAEELEALPAPVAEMVERCTARDPAARPRRAREVYRRLAGRRRWRLAAAAAAVAAVVCALWLGLGATHAPPSSALAVLASPVAPGEDQEETTVLLTELLAAELAGSRVKVLSPAPIYRGADGSTVAPADGGGLSRPGLEVLGVDLVARFSVGGEARGVDVEVARPDGELPLLMFHSDGSVPRRTTRERPWQPVFAPGRVARLEAVAAETADRLRRVLGERAPAPPAALRRRYLGGDAVALERHARGVVALTHQRSGAAIPILQAAVARQPDAFRFQYDLAHAAILEWDWKRARQAAVEARRLAEGLDGEERLRAEVMLRWADLDWPGAVEAWRRLLDHDTGRRDDVLNFSGIILPSSRFEEARELLSEVVARRPGIHDDPRFELLWVELLSRSEEFGEALTVTRRARARALELVAPESVLATWFAEANAQRRLGHAAAAAEATAKARQLAVELEDDYWLALSLRQEGTLLLTAGESEKAEEVLRRARDLAYAQGDRNGGGWCANNLAILATSRGHLGTARQLYEEALGVQLERADEFGIVWVRGNLSEVLTLEGLLDAAEKETSEVLSRLQTLDVSPQLEYQALARLGRIAVERGDVAEAERFLVRAEERGPEDLGNLVDVLPIRARMHLLRGDVVAARGDVDRALAISEKGGFAIEHAGVLAVQGEVAAAAGRFEDAVASYRQALDEAERSDALLVKGYALPRLGRALRRLGRYEEARRALREALELQTRNGQMLEQGHSRYELAELELAMGHPRAAETAATQALADAQEAGDTDGSEAVRALLRRLDGEGATPLRVAAGKVGP